MCAAFGWNIIILMKLDGGSGYGKLWGIIASLNNNGGIRVII